VVIVEQLVVIDVNPWRNRDTPYFWSRLMVIYFSLMSTKLVDVSRCDWVHLMKST
jgi:hypothetical protein